ncbi:PiggyBac transposable element-derived protein 4 [Eumeta japonica]|uniref:PiggyBac transposable element-derived protein 4 n=1 Tax=Eumeta variegata TaxID=151549 RepID=A0A4C1UWS7_EUMVA|nr:PiggyBac transposable element-derived protein 4 [Eumeta japonica]
MDRRDQQILQWLAESSDEEQVGGSDSEPEVDEIAQSDHNSASEIDQSSAQSSESSDNEEDSSARRYDNFYFTRRNGRNGPKQKWSKTPPSSAVRTRGHNIILHLPGVKSAARSAKTALECFSLFFSDEIFNLLVTCTNQYIGEVRNKFQRERDAKDTDVEEIKALLGLLIMSGVLRASHLNFRDLWATDGTGVEIFRLTMRYQRFLFLLRCLRFDDRTTRAERLQIDNLAAIREICDKLLVKYQEAYSPGENVTIDEQLIGFRGRFKGKVYMPSKPNKYGIKNQALVDSKTFYLLAFEVYSGKQPAGPYQVSNSPNDIVKRLVEPIKGSNRNVTTDNWYTSVKLATDLLDPPYKLTLVGTLKKNKPDIPQDFLPNKNKPQFSSLFGIRSKMTMVSYVPKPNKAVVLLSSMHHAAHIDPYSNDQQKPEIIMYYNSTKGGVDTNDHLCGTYSVGRRTKRWPLAIFFHLINVTGINALVIHRANTDKSSTHVRRHFLRQLSVELVQNHQKRRLEVNATPKMVKKRLLEVHELENRVAPTTAKRGRCNSCPRKNDRKIATKCTKFVCNDHSQIYCQQCNKSDSDSS